MNSSLELLESRIAPAAIHGLTLSYTDVDGDKVTVTFSKGDLTKASFTFDTGSVDGTTTAHQQLQLINLQGNPTFTGADINLKVTKAGGGDGFAAIGHIDASALNLGKVSIHGDLGAIDADSSVAATPGVVSLSVRSMGAYGVSSQSSGGNLKSDITGGIRAINVTADVKGAWLNVTGSIGSILIGGSLIGGSGASTGLIQTTGDMGSVKIGGEIIGGAGADSGAIESGGKIHDITVGGSILGGPGTGSKTGYISSTSNIGSIHMGGDLSGSSAVSSGEINCGGKLSKLTVGGSVRGGSGLQSGYIFAGDDVGVISIVRDLLGSSGSQSAQIDVNGKISSLTVGGSLFGGTGDDTASVGNEGDMGVVKIGGSIIGGPNDDSGQLSCGGVLTSLTIGGSVVGGSSTTGGTINGTGNIEADTYIGALKIGGDLVGGNAINGSTLTSSGAVHVINGNNSSGSIGSVYIGGSIIQGYLDNGSKSSANDNAGIDTQADLGPVTIRHDIIGGFLKAGGKIASVTLGGSLVGQTIANGVGFHEDGVIKSAGSMGPIKIGGDLIGGSADNTTYTQTGYIEGLRIASVTIGGSLTAGYSSNGSTLTESGGIRAINDIGAITIGGSIVGNATEAVTISARGQAVPGITSDVAIGSIKVSGRVEDALILAGYDTSNNALNGSAQMGAVSVAGDWIASSLVIGAKNSGFPNFGDSNDLPIGADNSKILARIASITIGGQVFGTPSSISSTDHFGFVAEQIGPMKIGGSAVPLPGTNNPLLIGTTGDVSIHIIA